MELYVKGPFQVGILYSPRLTVGITLIRVSSNEISWIILSKVVFDKISSILAKSISTKRPFGMIAAAFSDRTDSFSDSGTTVRPPERASFASEVGEGFVNDTFMDFL